MCEAVLLSAQQGCPACLSCLLGHQCGRSSPEWRALAFLLWQPGVPCSPRPKFHFSSLKTVQTLPAYSPAPELFKAFPHLGPRETQQGLKRIWTLGSEVFTAGARPKLVIVVQLKSAGLLFLFQNIVFLFSNFWEKGACTKQPLWAMLGAPYCLSHGFSGLRHPKYLTDLQINFWGTALCLEGCPCLFRMLAQPWKWKYINNKYKPIKWISGLLYKNQKTVWFFCILIHCLDYFLN